eukprot:CAMPEP_0197328068 /NCGR_PEP_ID=MMETSP0892-20130614/3913_1 /TAXON_ID=44058 ORGANISM="Aureoumbra lagunensis, Strain CCMP1510" /NCGR_SAMPLE_ID=MMETSP0892 /ASSEMBLY_ACC=CAM_ASM_000538 /LENGTH=377 /DNA_ID=CAMNT_0042823535 /DNA_START=169 /DNA_END=1299 /DNA_ORIENTATION=+
MAKALNAKERRRLARQAKRQEEESVASNIQQDSVIARGAVGTMGVLNAKERRRLARAAKRKTATPLVVNEEIIKKKKAKKAGTVQQTSAKTINEKNEAVMNSKARRKARRATERDAEKKEFKPIYIAFVGQLNYSTSANRLKQFLIDRGVQGHLKVRLRTDKKTGKSLGQAFVECESTEALHACVALHHATLDGRRINVEKSAGGGKATKQKRVSQLRSDQQQHVQQTVERIINEYLADGRLKSNEIDQGVRTLLERRSGKIATLALDEFCATEDRDTLDNPAAFLTVIVTRLSADEKNAHSEDDKILGIDDDGMVTSTSKTKKRSLNVIKEDQEGFEQPLKKNKIEDNISSSSMSSEKKQHDLSEIFPVLRHLNKK